jgi:hypothetical protein
MQKQEFKLKGDDKKFYVDYHGLLTYSKPVRSVFSLYIRNHVNLISCYFHPLFFSNRVHLACRWWQATFLVLNRGFSTVAIEMSCVSIETCSMCIFHVLCVSTKILISALSLYICCLCAVCAVCV